jgi:UDP-N-acetylglucosamine 2-epimerase (non-hydrolysing)
LLGGATNILLTEPKSYPVFVRLMMISTLVITDSGGVQEEAPALGKPVLVMRETTERPEAIDAGVVALVGPGRERLIAATSELLDDATAYARMAKGISPYGDGYASGRCLDALVGLQVAEFCPLELGAKCALG